MPVVINGSTGISGADGSAGTPAVQGTDTNTGVFFPAADTIAFSEGGTEAMRIDSSGNVGIGTTTPGQKVVISTTGNSNHLVLTGSQQNAMQFFSATGGSGYIIGRSLSGDNGNDFFIFDAAANANRFQISNSGTLLFNSGYGSAATAYGCRAWVNFNGTGVVAIRASGNVTSITDNGVGDYTVNFTNAMPDVNYSVTHWITKDNESNDAAIFLRTSPNSAYSTTAFRCYASYFITGTVGNFDSPRITLAVFR